MFNRRVLFIIAHMVFQIEWRSVKGQQLMHVEERNEFIVSDLYDFKDTTRNSIGHSVIFCIWINGQ